MKILFAFLTILFFFSLDLSAQRFQKYEKPSRNLSCIWQTSFDHFGMICDYENYKIRVNPQAKQAIKSMVLYLDNKLVGTDLYYPFYWHVEVSKNYLYPGIHTAKVKITDRCGKVNWISKRFRVTKCPR